MNGQIEQPTSGNDWSSIRTKGMLHEHLQALIAPSSTEPEQQTVIDHYEKQMVEHEEDFADLLTDLRKSYIFENKSDVESYLRSNRSVAPLLAEAATHFKQFFTESPLVLDVMTEEGGPRTINVLAYWRGEREQARKALDAFDESWWLDNLRKSSGKIVFDYEIQK